MINNLIYPMNQIGILFLQIANIKTKLNGNAHKKLKFWAAALWSLKNQRYTTSIPTDPVIKKIITSKISNVSLGKQKKLAREIKKAKILGIL